MSESLDFLWIDDDPSMETAADALAENTHAKVRFHDLTGKDLAENIRPLLDEQLPDLVIVDHKLDRTTGTLRSAQATGATISEVVKDRYPQLPVVCITKVRLDKDITFAQRSAYDAIVSAAHVTDKSQLLAALAKGFRQINNEPPKDDLELLHLLGCPEVDQSRLMQILPNNIKNGFGQKGFAAILWRWIDEVLFARPGFLYDSLWAATLVGAKERSFIEMQEKLRSAKYEGIFANDVCCRWWVSKIIEMLYLSDYANEQKDARVLGRYYLGIPEHAYSKCELSGDDLPETVAYTDTTNQNRLQVSLRFTQAHPGFQKLLFFEEIRMIKEAE